MWNLIQIYLGLLIYDSLQVYGISLGAVAYKCHYTLYISHNLPPKCIQVDYHWRLTLSPQYFISK